MVLDLNHFLKQIQFCFVQKCKRRRQKTVTRQYIENNVHIKLGPRSIVKERKHSVIGSKLFLDKGFSISAWTRNQPYTIASAPAMTDSVFTVGAQILAILLKSVCQVFVAKSPNV